MGPERACIALKERYPAADRFAVTLYGSLAKTGKGHGTERVIEKTLSPAVTEIILNETETDLPHPNTMDVHSYLGEELLGKARVMSVGGGSIAFEGEIWEKPPRVYALDSFAAIAARQ